jgi:hypothetical protein
MPSALATSALNPCYRPSSFDRTSPCYSGTDYPSYSALPPLEFLGPGLKRDLEGAASLDDAQAKQLIEAKGYSAVSGLQQDDRGIWRASALLKDGRPVRVTLDLEGNIYSELASLPGD